MYIAVKKEYVLILTPTKHCFKCNEWKNEEEEFYKHPQMLGGRLGKCKECTKKDTKQNTLKKLQDRSWVKKEQERQREKYYRLNYKEKKPTSESKKKAMDKYRGKYPEKSITINLSQHIKAPPGYEKHHWSYKRQNAKDLIFLTNEAHNRIHRHLIYCKTGKCYKTKDNILLDTRKKHEHFISIIL